MAHLQHWLCSPEVENLRFMAVSYGRIEWASRGLTGLELPVPGPRHYFWGGIQPTRAPRCQEPTWRPNVLDRTVPRSLNQSAYTLWTSSCSVGTVNSFHFLPPRQSPLRTLNSPAVCLNLQDAGVRKSEKSAPSRLSIRTRIPYTMVSSGTTPFSDHSCLLG